MRVVTEIMPSCAVARKGAAMEIANIKDILPFLNTVINGMAKHFGMTSEFVVHDYSGGHDSTIVSIVNGDVTGRRIGDSTMQVELKIMPGEHVLNESNDGIFNYKTQTHDGRILKSSTIYIRDGSGNVIGSICINSDVTQLQQAKFYIEKFIGLPQERSADPDMVFVGGVDDLLISLIHESINSVGVPISAMTREQKIAGIRYLKEKGAFKIQKASDVIARYYDVSKFTVYNYLDEVRYSSLSSEPDTAPLT